MSWLGCQMSLSKDYPLEMSPIGLVALKCCHWLHVVQGCVPQCDYVPHRTFSGRKLEVHFYSCRRLFSQEKFYSLLFRDSSLVASNL